ncbi:hypothetical protein [Streptococcus suis]|nr:hypothetical protein [Streptococcus suis]
MIKKKWLDKHAPKLETEPYVEGTVSHKNIKLYSRCTLADCGKTREYRK